MIGASNKASVTPILSPPSSCFPPCPLQQPDLLRSNACAQCHQQGSKLVQCGQCLSVSYCGKECQLQHWKKGGHKKACETLARRALAQLVSSSDMESLAPFRSTDIISARKALALLWRFRSDSVCLPYYLISTLRLVRQQLQEESAAGMEWAGRELIRSLKELASAPLLVEGDNAGLNSGLYMECLALLRPLGHSDVVLQLLREKEVVMEAAAATSDMHQWYLRCMWLDVTLDVMRKGGEASRDEAMVTKAMVAARKLVEFTSKPGRRTAGELSDTNVAQVLRQFASIACFKLDLDDLSLLLSRRGCELAPPEIRPEVSTVMVYVLLKMGRLMDAYQAIERVTGLAASDPDMLLAHYTFMIQLLTVVGRPIAALDYIYRIDSIMAADDPDLVSNRRAALMMEALHAQATAYDNMGWMEEALEMDSDVCEGLEPEDMPLPALVRQVCQLLQDEEADIEGLRGMEEDLLIRLTEYWAKRDEIAELGWMQKKIGLDSARRGYLVLLELHERMGNETEADEARQMVERLDKEDEVLFQPAIDEFDRALTAEEGETGQDEELSGKRARQRRRRKKRKGKKRGQMAASEESDKTDGSNDDAEPEEQEEEEEGLECAVCLDLLVEGEGGSVQVLACGHRFHGGCVTRLLEHNSLKKAHGPSRCPMCRSPLSLTCPAPG